MVDSAGEPVGAWLRVEWWLVHLVALHSVGVGLGLVFLTEWGAHLGGFAEVTPLFFARQAGVFHLVAAAVYVIDYSRGRGVNLLLMTKCFAVVFLLDESLLDGVPWVVPVSGVADGMMALAVYAVHAKASPRRSE